MQNAALLTRRLYHAAEPRTHLHTQLYYAHSVRPQAADHLWQAPENGCVKPWLAPKLSRIPRNERALDKIVRGLDRGLEL